MEYRIVIETERSGKKWFCVQKRFLIYFWSYVREIRDITMYRYIKRWETLEDAENFIQADVNARYKRSQQKIVKREYLIR